MEQYLIDNSSIMSHSLNELINQFVYNRVFEKLLQNDILLEQFSNQVFNKNNLGIQAYNPQKAYSKGDLIWFKCDNHKNEPALYLLESAVDNNKNTPVLEYDQERYTFIKSGWIDKNEYNTFLNNDTLSYIFQIFNKNIDTFHSYDANYHKYFPFSSYDDINDQIMRPNAINAKQDRLQVFFPYETIPLEKNNVILNGICRKWDNGLLEYDIVYKLGSNNEYSTINNTTYEVITCNNLSVDKNLEENKKYFNSESDMDIFTKNGDQQIIIENMLQKNKTTNCNAYSATIEFPIPFIDLNYMIFGSSVRSCEFDMAEQSIDSNTNCITYLNKDYKSITALYVLVSKKINGISEKNGLVSNSFHCQIIGKWK